MAGRSVEPERARRGFREAPPSVSNACTASRRIWMPLGHRRNDPQSRRVRERVGSSFRPSTVHAAAPAVYTRLLALFILKMHGGRVAARHKADNLSQGG